MLWQNCLPLRGGDWPSNFLDVILSGRQGAKDRARTGSNARLLTAESWHREILHPAEAGFRMTSFKSLFRRTAFADCVADLLRESDSPLSAHYDIG
jgi:hypothetical protein